MDPDAPAALIRRLVRRRLVVASLALAVPWTSHAQILQLWSHSAPRGDASGAVALGDTLMLVVNNEDQFLRLYARYPGTACPAPIYALNVSPVLALTGSDLTSDLESCAARTDSTGTTIFSLGSLGNSATGNLRPNRSRVFATHVEGDGSGSPPYTFTYLGRYDWLRDDILAWDANNLHGLGANYFGLGESAASGVSPKLVNGFNVEGLAFSADGKVAYVGFRTPFVNGSGPTTGASPRTHALLIPVLNLPSLVTGNPTLGPGTAQFGTPIVLPLGSRGIRSIDRISTGEFLITAGPADAVSNPPVAPLDFRVFLWSGHPLSPPVELATTFGATESPEACLPPVGPLTSSSAAQFINDDGSSTCWRSMTCPIGSAVSAADVAHPRPGPGVARFTRPPAPSPARHRVSFAFELPEAGWVDVAIVDVAGRRIATMWRGLLERGDHAYSWAGESDTANPPVAGVYWVSVRTPDAMQSRAFVWRP